MVWLPVGDALLDLLGGELFAKGTVDKGGEFGVGGEAQRDNLWEGEGGGLLERGGRKHGGVAEALSRRMIRSWFLVAYARTRMTSVMRAQAVTIHQRCERECIGH